MADRELFTPSGDLVPCGSPKYPPRLDEMEVDENGNEPSTTPKNVNKTYAECGGVTRAACDPCTDVKGPVAKLLEEPMVSNFEFSRIMEEEIAEEAAAAAAFITQSNSDTVERWNTSDQVRNSIVADDFLRNRIWKSSYLNVINITKFLLGDKSNSGKVNSPPQTAYTVTTPGTSFAVRLYVVNDKANSISIASRLSSEKESKVFFDSSEMSQFQRALRSFIPVSLPGNRRGVIHSQTAHLSAGACGERLVMQNNSTGGVTITQTYNEAASRKPNLIYIKAYEMKALLLASRKCSEFIDFLSECNETNLLVMNAVFEYFKHSRSNSPRDLYFKVLDIYHSNINSCQKRPIGVVMKDFIDKHSDKSYALK